MIEAQKQFLEIGNVFGTVKCLQSLGNILYMQDKYMEASDILMEAQKQFLEIGNVLGAAECLHNLDLIQARIIGAVETS